MHLNTSEITDLIKQRIDKFKTFNETYNEGTVVSVGDGIVRIIGLSDVMQGEMLSFPNDMYGMALNLEKDSVGAVILGDYTNIYEGMTVKCTQRILEVPVGNNFLGRVVNSLGEPIDGKGKIKYEKFSKIETTAPGVIDRSPITKPLQTGYKSIDTMTPIGKGQRELIIGDRQTGKTTLAIDTIINQKKENIKCIYVAIGKKLSTILNVVTTLEKYNALDYTIIVSSSSSEAAVLQYLAPYSGCTMGEFFRNKGEDALIIYDDLSKHAIAYRQISLLLRRPPGREAFPGDIFYLHSRLLERSSSVTKDYVEKKTGVKKTGSLTALPIVETQAGDISSFIPTNIISITDGQIFLESNLFNAGIRPAINPGISVSRVGAAAQTNIIKKFSSNIRTSLAQYRELASFSQFSSDLDIATKNQLIYGQKLIELLKQDQHNPLSVQEQAILIIAAEKKLLSDVEVNKIRLFESLLLTYFKTYHKKLSDTIGSKGLYNSEIESDLINCIKLFKKSVSWKSF
ncbi:ATP synthase subunit alpha [Buchnera aphidicola (Anoecia corni)]|uniref:ATP synthase subunit alpha n=1 Tax=Buchnera aphidicola (Anoecia corni) TaxID=2994477 RepID=A0AAT9IFV2_9GAMM